MSQYPYPYNTPYPVGYGGQNPYAQLLAPARRAAIGTYIIGGLIVICGLCFGVIGLAAPQHIIEQMLEGSARAEVTSDIMRLGLIILSVITLLFGIAMVVLGIFIWKGSTAAIITGIVLTSLGLLVVVGNALASIPRVGHAGTGAEMGVMLCAAAIGPIALLILLILLIQALKAPRALREAQAQYQAQYWQYQQQQQAYPPQQPPSPPAPSQPPPTLAPPPDWPSPPGA